MKVALKQAEYVLQTLAGEELFARWVSGEIVAMEMVCMTRNRYKQVPESPPINPWG